MNIELKIKLPDTKDAAARIMTYKGEVVPAVGSPTLYSKKCPFAKLSAN